MEIIHKRVLRLIQEGLNDDDPNEPARYEICNHPKGSINKGVETITVTALSEYQQPAMLSVPLDPYFNCHSPFTSFLDPFDSALATDEPEECDVMVDFVNSIKKFHDAARAVAKNGEYKIMFDSKLGKFGGFELHLKGLETQCVGEVFPKQCLDTTTEKPKEFAIFIWNNETGRDDEFIESSIEAGFARIMEIYNVRNPKDRAMEKRQH